MASMWLPIVDAEGTRASATPSGDDPSLLEVQFERGERIRVPRALTHQQQDGTYRFDRAFREAQVDPPPGGVVVPVLAEELRVGKQAVAHEKVRLTTKVSTRDERVDVPLVREHVFVERVPVGRMVDAPAPPRQEGDTFVYPVYEEVLVVEKRLVLKEEVRVTRTREQTRHQQDVALRNEDLTVEQFVRKPKIATGA